MSVRTGIWIVVLVMVAGGFMMAEQAVAGSASGWGECRWEPVGPVRSHQAGDSGWCPDGFFLAALDLDSAPSLDPHDSPVVGQALCCRPPGEARPAWGECSWVPVGAQRSHQRGPEWCPPGSFLTRLDLDGDRKYSARDTPYVGQARCCRPAGSGRAGWSSSGWVPVGGRKSHQAGPAWCPAGTYLTALDLDSEPGASAHDSPVVGAARCSRPTPAGSVTMVPGVVTGVLPAMPATPGATVDLKITNLSITPVPEGISKAKITLHTSRSYRVEAAIRRTGTAQPGGIPDFTVRTECVRGGSRFRLGETRIGVTAGSGSTLYAVYDIFPSSAGNGDCMLETMVDADNAVAESDESRAGNIWMRRAVIVP